MLRKFIDLSMLLIRVIMNQKVQCLLSSSVGKQFVIDREPLGRSIFSQVLPIKVLSQTESENEKWKHVAFAKVKLLDIPNSMPNFIWRKANH